VKKNILYIFTIITLAYSCTSDDDFSSDSNLSLAFSSDKVSFDTVFATIGSATKQFKVYNRNNNSLVIESIELMSAGESGFRINVDGEKGTRLENVEILKKDSLFGFVEVTVDPQNTSSPVLIRDSIKFVTNGNIQFLQLEAIGQDVIIWKTKTITKDSVITNTKPLLIYDSIVIKKNTSLTIEKGVKFFMKNKSSIQTYGTLKMNGTVDEPIVFRGSRFDKIEGDIPYDNVPGQWNGIYIYPGSYDNHLENVYVRNATRGITFYASDVQYNKASLMNVAVHNSAEYCMSATNSKIDAANCLFSNSKSTSVLLHGGEYTFLHCTIANYYRWSARQSSALLLSNFVDIGIQTPLGRCDFINSIIYGSLTEEVMFNEKSPQDFNYQFISSLIKRKETDAPQFKDIIWNKNPLFRDLNSKGIYNYNFELSSGSPAINEADKSYSLSVPFDLKGRSRLSDSGPDIGCYEWVQ
jgi:hypothetical protein